MPSNPRIPRSLSTSSRSPPSPLFSPSLLTSGSPLPSPSPLPPAVRRRPAVAPMGCNVRERSIRSGRRSRHSAKPPPTDGARPAGLPIAPSPAVPSAFPAPAPAPAPAPLPDADPSNAIAGGNPALDLNLNPNPNPNPSVAIDDAGWGYCTEEQLEELLLKNLDFVYKEALARLVSLGYDEPLALRAVLCNGHCYGSMDVLSNILHNAIAYLNAPPPPDGTAPSSGFSDLRHLQEYSLAGMVCLLQQVRPHLTRGDAMWCLLMSELHVGRASTIDIPSLSPAPIAAPLDAAPAGDYAPIDLSLLCPRRFDISPSMKPQLKRSAPTFSAAGYNPSTRRPFSSLLEQQHAEDGAIGKDLQDQDIVASVMKSLESMNIAEDKVALEGSVANDHKKEMILDLIRQIQELDGQVKERREWAQQKALQAARKLSSDLAELKTLQAEREENQRAKKGKQALEDSTMKRLSEMEAALKKASGQVDRANAVVRRLETENAEIRAEMEASKLSASESVRTCLEMAKREKKCLKRLLAWEKQRDKLQGEIAEERRKITQTQQELNEVQEAQKETEVKWRQEIKAKELAFSQVEEERRAKEAAIVNTRRKHEAQRQKIEIDFQRHKDDIQRLEEELSRLKASAVSTQLNHQTSNTLGSEDSDAAKPLKEANARMSQGFNKPQAPPRKINRNRECIICMQDEVSVVFLPCAHQVVCARCNEEHEKSKATCPCCNVQIEQRIRVYGASC